MWAYNGVMRRALSDAEAVGIAIGALVAITLAGLLGSVRGEMSQANAALVLVLVVVLAAYTGGRWAGAATGFVAAVAFDFFLTRPYGSLAIKSSDDVTTTVLLLAVGLAVGHIATSRREAKMAGQAGADEVAGLYRVASADDSSVAAVIEAVQAEVSAVLHLTTCRFDTLHPDPTLPELEHSGRVDAPYRFEGDGFVLPGDGVFIGVTYQNRTLGWLVCTPADPAVGISSDRRRTALILAGYLGLTIAASAGSDTA